MGDTHGSIEIGSARVGTRGQVVLPVGIRKACGIASGDTLIVMARPGPGGPSISLMRSDQLARMMAHMEETGRRLRTLVAASGRKRARSRGRNGGP